MAAPYALGVRLRIIGKLQGEDCINVMHFGTNTAVSDAGATDALILALLTAMLACVTEQLLPAVTSDYVLTGLEGIPIHPTKGDPHFLPAGTDNQGTASPVSASFLATLVQIRTGLGGKTHRGRIFLPPAGETEMANSTYSSPQMAALQAFITCVIGKFAKDVGTEDWRLGVLSRKGATNANPAFDTHFTEATSLIASNEVAKMSSRKKGHGN